MIHSCLIHVYDHLKINTFNFHNKIFQQKRGYPSVNQFAFQSSLNIRTLIYKLGVFFSDREEFNEIINRSEYRARMQMQPKKGARDIREIFQAR